MLQQRIRGWDFFIRCKADIFQIAKKDGKTKTTGGFTVSLISARSCSLKYAIRVSVNSSSGNASNDSLSDRERICLLAI